MAAARTDTPSTFTLGVDTGRGRIAVTVSRKRVRNLNLRVRADGSVVMSIPVRTGIGTAQAFLDRKAAWIAERVQRRRAAERPRDATGLETVPLWGKTVPLERALRHAGIRPEATRPTALGACARNDWGKISPAAYDLMVDELYRRETARALPGVAARAEAVMGVHASRWSLRAMKTRWGSCTPATAAIRINTRLAAYPPQCLEFVVAHELTHLMEPSHNARFHALLDIYCPDNRALAERLKRPARP